MFLFVTRGEDGVPAGICLQTLEPSGARPFRAWSVHVTDNVGIVGDEKIGPDTCNGACGVLASFPITRLVQSRQSGPFSVVDMDQPGADR